MAFEHWDKLAYGIERGECILFLGPDLPLIGAGGERRIPVRDLTARLLSKLPAQAGDEANNLARIAQRFLAQEEDLGLEMEVTRWHESLREQTSAVHSDLASLPFRLIVTSSHDPLLETALRRRNKLPLIEHYHYKGKNKPLLPQPAVETPLVFYLYGHVREASSVVLTETQLLDFLAALISKDPPLPSDLNAALTNGKLFLFLGFGLRQWYLRILLHVLKVLRKGSRTFAVEIGADAAAPPPDDTILFYRENFKVDVQSTDVFEFVHELSTRCAPAAGSMLQVAPVAGPGESTPLSGRGPKVFICHASEDKDRARGIHDALVGAGFDPWLDKESLRGGDRWDALIESTIKEVDYFVVVNSKALEAKSHAASYVNKEIKVALRAEDWRMGKFIIPVRVDDTPLLSPLTTYHAVDLAEPEGMRNLVRAIKRQAGAV